MDDEVEVDCDVKKILLLNVDAQMDDDVEVDSWC